MSNLDLSPDDDRLPELLRQAVASGAARDAAYGPDSPGGVDRMLAKARGELPIGRPEGHLPGLSKTPAAGRDVLPRRSWSLPWWLTIAAGVVVFLGAGAYVGRGVIVRVWSRSGEVTEIRVRDGDRIEIVGTNGQPIPLPPAKLPPPAAAPPKEAPPAGDEWIIDDGDPGYAETGNWQRGTMPGGYANDYRYNERGGTEVRWTFIVPPGNYEVFATWLPHPNRAASLTYFIHDGDDLKATAVVDQRATPSEPAEDFHAWQRLGAVRIESGELSVRVDARTTKLDLRQKTGNAICADAIRIRRLAE